MALKVEFKHQDTVMTGTILKNKGIAWQVQLDDGSTTLVQKKHVIRDWDETIPACAGCGKELPLNAEGFCSDCQDAADAAAKDAPATSLLGQLNGAAHAEPEPPKAKTPKAAKEPAAPRDPNLVSLKELCFELSIEPRIARRNLRKAKGNIGTGARWEWMKGSPELAEVRRVLLKTTEAE